MRALGNQDAVVSEMVSVARNQDDQWPKYRLM